MKDGKDIAVISIGPIGNKARSAIARAESESGRSIAHYDLRFLKPLDDRAHKRRGLEALVKRLEEKE